MEKNKYILQTQIQFSFDVPPLNITQLNVPHEVSLTEAEVLILRQAIPNIKIVPVQKPVVVEKPAKVTAALNVGSIEIKPKAVVEETATEPLVEKTIPEPTVEQTTEVTTTVTLDVPVSKVLADGTNNPVESSYLSVNESLLFIKNANSLQELSSFLSVGEKRKGILEEYRKREEELSK